MRPTRRSLVTSIKITCALAFALAGAGARAGARAQTSRETPQTVVVPRNSPSPETPPDPDPSLTLLDVSVTDDYGRNVSGLSRDAFAVYEGDKEQELLYFDASEAPQGVGIVFDVSRSMKDTAALEFARGAIVRFVRQAHASNEYFVVGFDGSARLLADWTRDQTELIVGLNKLAHIEPRRSGTALYDALALAVEKVARGPRLRPVLVLVSDGRDTESNTKLSTLREMLRRTRVTLYAVRVTDDNVVSEPVPTELEELTRMTGGRVFDASTAAGISDAFQRVGLDLHNLYTLGFKPSASDGKWRKLKVKVKPPPKWPHVNARAREGFYPDAAAPIKR